jgi:hypothetical protein
VFYFFNSGFAEFKKYNTWKYDTRAKH